MKVIKRNEPRPLLVETASSQAQVMFIDIGLNIGIATSMDSNWRHVCVVLWLVTGTWCSTPTQPGGDMTSTPLRWPTQPGGDMTSTPLRWPTQPGGDMMSTPVQSHHSGGLHACISGTLRSSHALTVKALLEMPIAVHHHIMKTHFSLKWTYRRALTY